jgi:hypothetical protein
VQYVTIAGYEFFFPYLTWIFPLIMYKNSAFLPMDDAYEAGWLTDDDVGEIWQLYMSKFVSKSYD